MATKKTTTTPAEPEALVQIRFTTPTRLDGQDFEQDQVVELNQDAAAFLVELGLATAE
jgi:hypothetical protein